MVARVATFEGVDVAAARGTIDAALQQLQPLFREMPGWRGVVDLADRSSGKVLSINLFDSEENVQAAEPIFEVEMPRRLGYLMQPWTGHRVAVERYDVLLEQRP